MEKRIDSKRLLNFVVLSVLIFFTLSIIFGNIKSTYYFCLHSIDFSTYQQAIYEIAHGDSWNPYISIRDLKILNDHADPAVILGALFLKIAPTKTYSLLVFEWLWFVGAILLVFFLGNFRSRPRSHFLLAFSLFVFSRPLLMGLEFPIHPTTWSMFFGVLLSYFLARDNFRGVVASVIAICFFREIYSFMAIGLSGFYFINRRWKEFLSIFSIGATFFLVLVIFRPYFVGPTVDYGNSFMRDMLHGGVPFIFNKLMATSIPWNTYMQYIPPLFFLGYFEFFKNKRWISSPLLAVIFFIAPALFIHLMMATLAHHQSIPMVSPIIGIMVFSSFIEKVLEFRKSWLPIILILFIATSSSRYTKAVNLLFLNKAGKTCQLTSEKREKGVEVLEAMKNLDKSKVILSSGTIIPAIIEPGLKIYQISDSIRVQPRYDYLVFERPGVGNTYPLSDDEVKGLLERCSKFMTRSILDNGYYVIWEGNFSDACTMQTTYWPNLSGSLIPR